MTARLTAARSVLWTAPARADVDSALESEADVIVLAWPAAADGPEPADSLARLMRHDPQRTMVAPAEGADWRGLIAAGVPALVLPVADGHALARAAAALAVAEAETAVPEGRVGIAGLVEAPGALFGLGTLSGVTPRLVALAWSASALASAFGAGVAQQSDGRLIEPLRHARTLCLAAARHAGIRPIDTAHPDPADLAGFSAACEAARVDGFAAKIATGPLQAAAVNAAFAAPPQDPPTRNPAAAYAAANAVADAAADGVRPNARS